MQPLETITLSPRLPAKSTVIWLHGLGADGHDFVDLVPELQLAEELAVRFVFPHAPIRQVALNGDLPMRAWFNVYNLDAEARVDTEGLAASDKALHALIQHEHAQGIPFEHIILAGFSQGGAVALYTGLHYPKRLGGIMALSSFLPLQHHFKPIQPKQIPIFMAHGEQDPMVALAWGEATREKIEEHGYHVTWHTYPIPHAVSNAEVQDIAVWMKQILQA